jgi:hypothetical protein
MAVQLVLITQLEVPQGPTTCEANTPPFNDKGKIIPKSKIIIFFIFFLFPFNN